jgi:hypothetical protein
MAPFNLADLTFGKTGPAAQGRRIRGHSDLADKNARNSGPPGMRENAQGMSEEYAITGGMVW